MLLAAVSQPVEIAVAAVVQMAVDWVAHIVEEDERAAVEHGLHDTEILSPILVLHACIQTHQIALGALVVVVLRPGDDILWNAHLAWALHMQLG